MHVVAAIPKWKRCSAKCTWFLSLLILTYTFYHKNSCALYNFIKTFSVLFSGNLIENKLGECLFLAFHNTLKLKKNYVTFAIQRITTTWNKYVEHRAFLTKSLNLIFLRLRQPWYVLVYVQLADETLGRYNSA